MTTAKRTPTGTPFLKSIADRLTRAAAAARAARDCADAGDNDGAVALMENIDIPVYEAQSLINASYILNRIDGDEDGDMPLRRRRRKKRNRTKR